jgi:hypothetical protein
MGQGPECGLVRMLRPPAAAAGWCSRTAAELSSGLQRAACCEQERDLGNKAAWKTENLIRLVSLPIREWLPTPRKQTPRTTQESTGFLYETILLPPLQPFSGNLSPM